MEMSIAIFSLLFPKAKKHSLKAFSKQGMYLEIVEVAKDPFSQCLLS